jgi:hypothetical protein
LPIVGGWWDSEGLAEGRDAMSDPTKRKPDANATIQISLDQVQLFDPNAVPPPSPSEAAMRQAPPPLPTSPLTDVAQAPAPNAAKTIAYVAMIVVLVGLAIVGGLLVGTRARGSAPVTSTAAAPSATTAGPEATPSVASPASAAPKTLTLPTIEMR